MLVNTVEVVGGRGEKQCWRCGDHGRAGSRVVTWSDLHFWEVNGHCGQDKQEGIRLEAP